MTAWTLTRLDTLDVLTLHRQYVWSDEYEWSPIAQSQPEYSLTGAMSVQQGTKKAGRPITLDCQHARIIRADVQTLQAWSAVPELTMTLKHPDGRQFTVMFARPALSDIKEIKPMRPADQAANDKMQATLHFITVQ